MKKYFLEIQNRLILLSITVLFNLVVCYFYKEILVFLVVKPNYFLINQFKNSFYFIFTSVTDVLNMYFKIIFFFSFQIFIVYFIYHCFIFFIFALFKSEYVYLRIFIKILFINWFLSVFFINYLFMPTMSVFFFSLQKVISYKFITLHFESKLIEYLDFYITLYHNAFFYFQSLTILVFIFYYIKLNILVIKRFRKIYYFFFFIFSTLLTPPDIFSQIFLSFCLILTFEIFTFSFLLTLNLRLSINK
jgi:sec-independent protein translocase protein TatC